MRSLTYTRLELVRVFRSRRFVFLGFVFPLGLYYAIAAPDRHELNLGGTGISAPLYLMVGLAAFGAMNAMMSTGSRIAAERAAGWNRQLQITPLSTRDYFRAKVATGYAMALLSLGALYAAGVTLGVDLSLSAWLSMTGLLLVGLVPFALFGILLGHLLTPDSIGPTIGGAAALLATVGGSWFPITHGALKSIAERTPSYWLVQASHLGIGGKAWSPQGWITMMAWTLVLAALAHHAYQRDTHHP